MSLKERWHAHNKFLKQCKQPKVTFDEYLLYINGKSKSKKTEPPKEVFISKNYHRQSPNIPSAGTGIGVPKAPLYREYSGSLVKGICTMHKSNAVPVINKEQMVDISKMRRN